MANKRVRGRWTPSSEQIALAVDCAVARVPLEKAAELIGVRPRTLWMFAKRIGRPFPARVVAPRTPETPALGNLCP
jgi:hypothetical protein